MPLSRTNDCLWQRSYYLTVIQPLEVIDEISVVDDDGDGPEHDQCGDDSSRVGRA